MKTITPKFSIQYLLFDVTVITILLAVIFQYLLDDDGKIPIQQKNESSRQQQAWIKANDDKVQSYHIFGIGEIVELYSDKSTVALPVVVTENKNSGGSSSSSDGGVLYNLRSYTSMGGIREDISSKFVHPYEVLKEGTEARCFIKEGKNPVSCTILSHHGKKGNDLTYDVSYPDEDNCSHSTLILRSLSYSRIQRIRLEVKGSGLTKGEWLEKQRARRATKIMRVDAKPTKESDQ